MQHRAHVVIAGGANNERLGIQSLADVAGVMASPHHPISVWLNPHTDLLAFTPAEFMGFPEVEAIDQAQKIEGCWILPALARRSFDRDVQLARNAGWTFPVVIGDASKRPAELNGTIRLARLRNITAHYLDLFTGALLGRVES